MPANRPDRGKLATVSTWVLARVAAKWEGSRHQYTLPGTGKGPRCLQRRSRSRSRAHARLPVVSRSSSQRPQVRCRRPELPSSAAPALCSRLQRPHQKASTYQVAGAPLWPPPARPFRPPYWGRAGGPGSLLAPTGAPPPTPPPWSSPEVQLRMTGPGREPRPTRPGGTSQASRA